jgi:hypothetical protein
MAPQGRTVAHHGTGGIATLAARCGLGGLEHCRADQCRLDTPSAGTDMEPPFTVASGFSE